MDNCSYNVNPTYYPGSGAHLVRSNHLVISSEDLVHQPLWIHHPMTFSDGIFRPSIHPTRNREVSTWILKKTNSFSPLNMVGFQVRNLQKSRGLSPIFR